jgi:hypothetical protein
MQDALTQALIAKLNPLLYGIGLIVVLGLVSFGGTILSWYFKSKEKRDDSISQALAANTVAIARLESKLDIFISQHDKDLKNLGDKIRAIDI